MVEKPSLKQRILWQFTWQKARYRWRQFRNLVVAPKKLWAHGLEEEIDFWRDVLTNPDNVYHDIMVSRSKPRPLDSSLKELLDTPVGGTAEILDIGAGPISAVGTIWEGRTVHVTAVDPLADAYAELLKSVGWDPPVKTQLGQGEQIGSMFKPNSFDLIHSRNALDHSYDPMSILQQAMVLLKPGGYMHLEHFLNEGKRVYGGPHQWNLSVKNDQFVIWNMGRRYVVAEHLPALADCQTKVEVLSIRNREWLTVRLRKKSEV